MSVDLTNPLELELRSVETTLEGFLTQTYWPFLSSSSSSSPFSSPLLLRLFPLAPPSAKGKTKYPPQKNQVLGRCCIVLCWGLVCVHVHFMCLCILFSDLCEVKALFWWTKHHINRRQRYFLVCQCRMLPVDLPDSNHASMLALVQLIALLCTSDQTHAHVCAHARTHSSLKILCWPCYVSISGPGSVTVFVNVRLHFAILPAWYRCENKIACVYLFW